MQIEILLVKMQNLDAYKKPPDHLKKIYKFYQSLNPNALQMDPGIIDFQRGLSAEQSKGCKKLDTVLPRTMEVACLPFGHRQIRDEDFIADIDILEFPEMPGKDRNKEYFGFCTT